MNSCQVLQKYRNKTLISYHSNESDVKIKILKELFTLKEAFITKKLNFFLKILNKIHLELKKMRIILEKLKKQKLLKTTNLISI